jgi:hypothetical protein
MVGERRANTVAKRHAETARYAKLTAQAGLRPRGASGRIRGQAALRK